MKNVDVLEVFNNEEFIKFFISYRDLRRNKHLEIKIISEYSRNKDIIDVLIRNDTIVLIKKQELIYSMPLTVKDSELLTDTTHFEKNIFINNHIDKFCQKVYLEKSDLLIEFCSYIDILKSNNEELFLKYFNTEN
ncbi:MAG: hypothetical protein Kow0079_17760 [Vicingaceae bacterium]